MDRIKEIEERLSDSMNEYLPFFNGNGEMREWNQLFSDLKYLLEENKRLREALDKAHVLLDKYEAIIDLDVIEENKRLRGIIHNLKGSAYELRQHALKTIHDKTELDIDKVIDSTDDMCKYAQQALRENSK